MAGLRAPWARYLLVGVLLAVGEVAMPAGPARDVAYVFVAGSGALAMVVGVRRHRPAASGAWYLIVAGLASWIVGGAVYALTGPAPDAAVEFGLADLFFLATYPLVSTGMVQFARSRGTGDHGTVMLDTAILTVGVGLLSWVFLVEPAWASAGGSLAARLAQVGYPLGNVLLFGALLRLANAPGTGRTWSGVLASLVGTMLAVQGLAQAASVLPTFDVHPTGLDPRWLPAFVMAGAAGLHPSMRVLSAPAPSRAETNHPVQVLGLGAALLIGPAILGGQLLTGAPLRAGPVAVVSAVLVLLVMLRMLAMVRLEHTRATSDHLTGLPNRRALYRQATSRLADPTRRQALLMLDLDRFKEVNDSLGHHAGDQLLIQVGARLRHALRAEDLLVRLGGDEFAILLADAGLAEARTVADALASRLAQPFPLEELGVHSTVSIGVALFPDHGTDVGDLLRKADIAMYRAKASGGVRVYGGDDDATARLRMVEEFRDALTRDELVVHYQPKLDLASGAVHGVEALVRWDHPRQGLLYPAAFLERVEEAGLMRAMTRAVLALALDQAARWVADARPLTIAVNLSASSLVDTDLPDEVATMLAVRGLPPSALQLEITEEFLMADRDRARAILTRLRDHGIQIAVDDFGTGYSSLAYLRDLPIDELKLDRSFVFPMADDARAAALVASTIDLAHSLDLRMVAEGVEDGVACSELTRMGCDQAQGFHLSRPLPAVELDLWLDARAERRDLRAPRTPRAP